MSKTSFSRRGVLKFLGALPVALTLPGCAKADPERGTAETPNPLPPAEQKSIPSAKDLSSPSRFIPGYLAIIQGPTSDTEALINIMTPRLKAYTYEAFSASGKRLTVNKYETVKGPLFYNFDKLRVSNMTPGVTYTLRVMDGSTVIDERSFSSLDLSKRDPRFGMLSCMADDYRFDQAIDPMWKRLEDQNVDFLVLTGDQVYVDSKEFVERQKATEADLWGRYQQTLTRLPLYHWLELKPIFALWDDHDFGTNDGDRDFIGKAAADRLFRAVFGGQSIAGVWEQGPAGTSGLFTAFGQRFFTMDDRSFRQNNKDGKPREDFGHWGQDQHDWLIKKVSADSSPAWIFNGGQFFNGVSLSYKEGFEENAPVEFAALTKKLAAAPAPVVFGSGDVHLGEIMGIPASRLGYDTFELTSSSMHSYAPSTGWENPLRLKGAYTIEFNFMVIQTEATKGGLDVDVQCLGLAPQAYFEKSLRVRK